MIIRKKTPFFAFVKSSRMEKRSNKAEAGGKPFHCLHCDSSFTILSSLMRHKTIHTGEKPFECKDCNASFRTKQDLVQHERRHTGERPYRCEDCDSNFLSKKSLTYHALIHSTAGKKLKIFEKVWITETREEVYIAELICQVSMVYDYPRHMRETQ